MSGGSGSTLTDWMVDTLETVLPQLSKARIVTEGIASMEALKAQIKADVLESRFQVVGPAQVCAWVRL
jgi:hypothetical protein